MTRRRRPISTERFALRTSVLAASLGSIVAAATSGRAEGAGLVTAAQVQQATAQLDALAQTHVDRQAVPGLAIAVVFQDAVVFAEGYGVRVVGRPERVDADTVFQLASVSKPVGATVVAALVGKGKVTWDSSIAALDPGFAMYDPWVTREVTIRDMYAHRSGLPPHSGDLLEDLGATREQVLHQLRFQRPSTSFRSAYAYTNFGITAAAVAAARPYALAWEEASEQYLYRPLGMTSTSSCYADFAARPNHALGHVLSDDKWTQKYARDPDAQSPAGGVSSSVNDVARWMRLQLADGVFAGQPVVDAKALAETRRPHILTGFNPFTGMPGFYGLGWNVTYDPQGRLRLNHSGAFALGAGTHVNLVPGEQLGIVVLTNAAPIGLAEGLATTFMDLALYGSATQDWIELFKKRFADPAAIGVTPGADYSKPPAARTPPLGNGAYAGSYANAYFGGIEVVEREGRLAIVQGPKGMMFPMTHYDRDTFTYQPAGENAAGPSGITFTIGPDGKATQVVVEHLNARGEGTFARRP